MNSMSERVRAQMAVVDVDGVHVGIVDRVEDACIQFTRTEGSDHEAHGPIPVSSVETVEGDTVKLNVTAKASREGEGPSVARWSGASERVQEPATHFYVPDDIVSDRQLSDAQKRAALGTLEQDARQLSDATTEGMVGGERSNLDEILASKAKLGPKEDAAQPAEDRMHPMARAIQQHPLACLALAVVTGIGVGVSLPR
ncbi:DUF2171 domain-containing protein [Roseomonas rosulenta]|uniref:DUF2171 domain-containing protein n=1 Tax=Roseomonas rosulenta TaxID=2748667 RepID=UPI0018E02008|nr:DUF2171 domain-containing protein [Roseomonas rosulenta]